MSTVEVHCVPMAVVAMDACMLWLRDTWRLQTASGGAAMMQLYASMKLSMECLLLILCPEIGIPRKAVRGVIDPLPRPIPAASECC